MSMFGNFATVKPAVGDTITASGNTTLGYLQKQNSTQTQTYPCVLHPVSGAAAITITLPKIALSATTIGTGGPQEIDVLNLASQSVVVSAASGDQILGSSATLAANVMTRYVSDASSTWYRSV